MDKSEIPERMTVAEAAKYMRLSRAHLDQTARAGKIPSIRLGENGKRGRVLLKREDCDAYLEKHYANGPTGKAV